jgi:nicotinamidase-related amidase
MTNQALVIIDVQNSILGPTDTERQKKNHAALDEVIARIALLIARARKLGIPILFVQHNGSNGHRLETGTSGWKIRAEIAPVADDPVVQKSSCDSFFQTALCAELESRHIDKLTIAGCMTQFCVDTTVRRAVSLGYDVDLVSDGHMTADFGGLSFEQIIAHHNALLDGFDAGLHSVRIVPHDQIFV